MDDTNLTPWGAVMSAAKDDADEPDTPAATAEEIAGPSPVLEQQITPEMVAGGYQLGAGSQQITVGGEGKGPKVPMIIAAVLVVVGLIGFAVGAVVGGSIEDTFNRLSTVDYTNQIGASGEITYKDADGAGEEGWYLLIPGDPKADENDNGIIDACEGSTSRSPMLTGTMPANASQGFPVQPTFSMAIPTPTSRTLTSPTT